MLQIGRSLVRGWLSGLRLDVDLRLKITGSGKSFVTNEQTRQSEKYQCRTDTVSSPDNGHIVARNMYRS